MEQKSYTFSRMPINYNQQTHNTLPERIHTYKIMHCCLVMIQIHSVRSVSKKTSIQFGTFTQAAMHFLTFETWHKLYKRYLDDDNGPV